MYYVLPTFGWIPSLSEIACQGLLLAHLSGNVLEIAQDIYTQKLSDYWLFRILKMKNVEHAISSLVSFFFTTNLLIIAPVYYPKWTFCVNKITFLHGFILFTVLLVIEKLISPYKQKHQRLNNFWLIDLIPPGQIISVLIENRSQIRTLPPLYWVPSLLCWFITCSLIRQMGAKTFIFIKYSLIGIAMLITLQHANTTILYLALATQTVLFAKYIWLNTCTTPTC